ncbi:MAG: hypothetical protein CSA49_03890 [Gammaproteobacteria bacterium]|nr:MAG: hypothetical protein CSA49_03890 [Gammaproteobacteria bacterium]
MLKIASSAVRKCVTRPADMVGRVGAAEFGVLMPNTRIQGAEHVANAIYDNVASKPLNIGICSMSVKVSIVVLSRLPNTDVNGEQFLEEAKERLISISENGGNRIVYFDGDKAY